MTIPETWRAAPQPSPSALLDVIESARSSGGQILVLCARADTAEGVAHSVHSLTAAKAVTLTAALTGAQLETVDAYLRMPGDFPTVIVATDDLANTWTPPPRCTQIVRAEPSTNCAHPSRRGARRPALQEAFAA